MGSAETESLQATTGRPEAGDEQRTGAQRCAEALRDAGVRTVFGIPGQRILPLVHELRNGFGIDVVLTRHEQGAAFMADAYARVHGLGCCFGTSGPGATNLLTGSAAAFMDSVPMLAITAQAETGEFGRYGIQEGTGLGRTPDIPAMFAATCKASAAPMTADDVVPALREMLAVATAGRPGATHIDIPSDLLLAHTGPPVHAPADQDADGAAAGPAPDDAAIAAVVEALQRAERPLVLAGNGVIRSGSADALLALAEAADLPLAGSFLAKSVLDEHHPLVLGPVGLFGRPEANAALHREADLVLALGVSFNYMTTAGWSAELGAERLIRVDLDQRELGTNYEGGLSILADVGRFVEALRPHGAAIAGAGRARVARLREEAAAAGVDEPAGGGLLHPVEVCRAVNPLLDEGTTVIADVGQNAYWVERHLRTRGGGRFLINGGLGAMGHGVAGAIGTWAGLRDAGRPTHVLATCGDGGFMMGALELSTAASLGADITWLVFDNSALGTQRAWFEREGHAPVACDMPPIDYVALSASMGVPGEHVDDVEGLTAALERAWSAPGPRVVVAAIDPAPAPAPFAP